MKKTSKKSIFARLMACTLVLMMVLSACGDTGSKTPGRTEPSNQPSQGQPEGGGEPAGDATTTRFEAEYATINGSVPGLVSVFFGASNKCMLEPVEGSSNGYVVSNCYVEGNDDDKPSITFTITSDVEAEAKIILGVGASWHMDESFATIYDDTDVNTAYPLTVNGTALTTTASISASSVKSETVEDSVIRYADDITAADYGTVTLKAGENTITITATEMSKCIDYLEIVTTAKVTMEEDHTHTYRVYSEDDFEYIEVEV